MAINREYKSCVHGRIDETQKVANALRLLLEDYDYGPFAAYLLETHGVKFSLL